MCDKREPMDGVVGDGDISVGGYMILEADSYDHAVELSKECPSLDVGAKMEIREVVEM